MINHALYRLFFEEAGDALVAVSLPDGKMRAVNRTFTDLTGYTPDELEGESIAILNASIGEEHARERKLDHDILSFAGFYNDIVVSTREGAVRFVSVKIRHVTLDGQSLALAVLSDDTARQFLIRDLTTKHQSLEHAYAELERVHTELKVSQERMSQAAKLAALGELAAGLSHELNQPLTGIRGFAQEIGDILKTQPKPRKGEVRALCETIVQNADKMAGLLSHFRDFARQERKGFEGADTPEPVDLRKVIGSVVRLLGHQLDKHKIKVEVLGSGDVRALGQAHPIEQVLINLLTNGRDAVLARTGERLGRIEISLEDEGPSVLVRVRDNGPGIPDSIRSKIFDPFFTTKEPGKGTGLGLSISYGIAHRLNGELALESSDSHGSTFSLRLPKANELRRVA